MLGAQVCPGWSICVPGSVIRTVRGSWQWDSSWHQCWAPGSWEKDMVWQMQGANLSNWWILEHSLKMESCENSERWWENSKKIRQESCDLSFLKNSGLFLKCASVPLPRGEDKSEFASYYSLQLAITCFCPMGLVLVMEHFTQVIPLSPHRIKCRMLWIKLAIEWIFGPPQFQAPFSQVHATN